MSAPFPAGEEPTPWSVGRPAPAAARREAERAARMADVCISRLEEPGDLAEAEQVLRRVWGARPTDSSIATPALMRALAHAGGYVAGVRALHGSPHLGPADGATAVTQRPGTQDTSGPLIGVCLGFCAAPAERSLHSHVAGLIAGSVGRGAGRALKLDQRAWALENGLTSITWTFDPLVSRNAHFNLQRLGAHLVAITLLDDLRRHLARAEARDAGRAGPVAQAAADVGVQTVSRQAEAHAAFEIADRFDRNLHTH